MCNLNGNTTYDQIATHRLQRLLLLVIVFALSPVTINVAIGQSNEHPLA